MFTIVRNLCLATMVLAACTAVAAQDSLSGDAGNNQPAATGFTNDSLKADAERFLNSVEAQLENESDPAKIFELTTKAAPAAYLAGQFAKAKQYAGDALKFSEDQRESWNYGNAVHVGNIVLGLVALTDGKDASAREYLLAAGKTPGSPQLDSFGPNMLLARDFLAKGEREVVFKYFDLCAKFWKMERGELERWKAAIGRSEMPDFGPHLHYQGF